MLGAGDSLRGLGIALKDWGICTLSYSLKIYFRVWDLLRKKSLIEKFRVTIPDSKPATHKARRLQSKVTVPPHSTRTPAKIHNQEPPSAKYQLLALLHYVPPQSP